MFRTIPKRQTKKNLPGIDRIVPKTRHCKERKFSREACVHNSPDNASVLNTESGLGLLFKVPISGETKLQEEEKHVLKKEREFYSIVWLRASLLVPIT